MYSSLPNWNNWALFTELYWIQTAINFYPYSDFHIKFHVLEWIMFSLFCKSNSIFATISQWTSIRLVVLVICHCFIFEKLNAKPYVWSERRTNIFSFYRFHPLNLVSTTQKNGSRCRKNAMIHLVTHNSWRNMNWFATIQNFSLERMPTHRISDISWQLAVIWWRACETKLYQTGVVLIARKLHLQSARYNELVEPSTKVRICLYSSFTHFSFLLFMFISLMEFSFQQKLLSETKVLEKCWKIFVRPTH